jgi:hypothetical protein
MIVNLAVISNPDVSIFIAHRLMAASEVDDTQTAMSQGRAHFVAFRGEE